VLAARWSVNSLFASILLGMGILGLVLALSMANIFRNLTLESQQHALVKLVQLKKDVYFKDMELQLLRAGSSLVKESRFLYAIDKGKTSLIKNVLEKQYLQLEKSGFTFSLNNVAFYDRNFNFRTQKTAARLQSQNYVICPGVLKQARQRSGLDSLQTISELCRVDNEVYYTVLIPVGGYKQLGYLVLVIDPRTNLRDMIKEIEFPARISFVHSDKNIYVTHDWMRSKSSDPEGQNIVSLEINTSDNEPLMLIQFSALSSELVQSLSEKRSYTIGIAITVTMFAIMLALWVLRATIIKPIKILQEHLHHLREAESNIGTNIALRGTVEIKDLSASFNLMSTDLKSMYNELKGIAFTDTLTQLPNRYSLNQKLESITSSKRNSEHFFSLFLMDLDKFKTVNDTHGHHVGDQLLQQVAHRIQYVLRDTDSVTHIDRVTRAGLEKDVVARLGGDEFAVILPGARNQDDAISVAKKITHTMEESFSVEKHQINVGISIGMVLYPEQGGDMHELMKKADVAMYYAKKNKLGYCLYDSDQRDEELSQQLTG